MKIRNPKSKIQVQNPGPKFRPQIEALRVSWDIEVNGLHGRRCVRVWMGECVCGVRMGDAGNDGCAFWGHRILYTSSYDYISPERLLPRCIPKSKKPRSWSIIR